MADVEKVIKGLELCITDMNRSDSMPCMSCPYGSLSKGENCQRRLFADALSLLKEQETEKSRKELIEKVKETVQAYRTSRTGTNGFSIIWTCGNCGADLHPNNANCKYCPSCGTKVKWEYDDDEERIDELQRDYQSNVEMGQYCERYEPTYNPEDGSM